MSESYARTICQWSDKSAGDCRPAADAILIAAAKAGAALADLAGLAAEIYARSLPDTSGDGPDERFEDRSLRVETTFDGGPGIDLAFVDPRGLPGQFSALADSHEQITVTPEAALVGHRSSDRETHRLSLTGDLPDPSPDQLEDGPELGGRTRVDLHEDFGVAVLVGVYGTGDRRGIDVAGQDRVAGEADDLLA